MAFRAELSFLFHERGLQCRESHNPTSFCLRVFRTIKFLLEILREGFLFAITGFVAPSPGKEQESQLAPMRKKSAKIYHGALFLVFIHMHHLYLRAGRNFSSWPRFPSGEKESKVPRFPIKATGVGATQAKCYIIVASHETLIIAIPNAQKCKIHQVSE